MNATRAATIRLRSLVRRRRLARPRADADAGDPGPARGGDPRLQARALLGRRRGVRHRRGRPARATRAATTRAPTRGSRPPTRPPRSSRACDGQTGEITKLEKSERKERPPLLYDLTSLQRDANSRFGFSARRTLAAAQRLYEEHKALTYPRTNSRYLTERHDRRDQADRAARRRAAASTRQASEYVLGLDVLPLGRVVNDAKVTDHHAIIPTRAERHPVEKMNDDDRRIYDLVVAPLPGRLPPRGGVREHARRDHRRRPRVPHPRQADARARAGAASTARRPTPTARPRRRRGPRAAAAQARARRAASTVQEVASEEKETKPPRRYTEGSLLAAMETAGKLVDEEELREAMKDSGIGTPATRAAIIERLIQVGYIERDGRALVVTEKGLNVIRLLGEHALTSPGPDRRVGAPAGQDRDRRGLARGVHGRHRQVHRGRPSASSTPSSRTCGSRAPTSGRARSAAATSSRTARATRAGRARIRAAAS